jgi:hypothetical protein
MQSPMPGTRASAPERALSLCCRRSQRGCQRPGLSRSSLGERSLSRRARVRRIGSGVAVVVACVSARGPPRGTAPPRSDPCSNVDARHYPRMVTPVQRPAATTPWVPKTLSTSCEQAIFVDLATDANVSSDAVLLKIDGFGQRFQRRGAVPGAVRPVLIVVSLIITQLCGADGAGSRRGCGPGVRGGIRRSSVRRSHSCGASARCTARS